MVEIYTVRSGIRVVQKNLHFSFFAFNLAKREINFDPDQALDIELDEPLILVEEFQATNYLPRLDPDEPAEYFFCSIGLMGTGRGCSAELHNTWVDCQTAVTSGKPVNGSVLLKKDGHAIWISKFDFKFIEKV